MSEPPLRGTTVLIAGGEPAEAAGLARVLSEAGARVAAVADSEHGGLAIDGRPPDAVVALGAVGAIRARVDPFALGAGPPIVELAELGGDPAAGLSLVLARHGLHRRVAELESIVAAQAVHGRRELEAADRAALRRLAAAADYRDDNTHQHTERVAHLAALLGRRLGLAGRTVALVRAAAPLHDLGKIAIPDSILLKPDRLSPEEFEVVKTHAVVGARILAGEGSELVETAARIARSHHERWDGTGYPDGLAGDEIPLAGRLVAVADVFDVLLHERPYKEGWTVEDAAEEIRRGAGSQFDPGVVEAFDAIGPRAWRSSPDP